MPLDAPSSAAEFRAIRLSALLDAGLPDAAFDSAASADSALTMRTAAVNLQIDDNLKQWVGSLPMFRTPLEVATFFIGVKYSELGGAGGVLGSTATSVSACPDGVGFYRHFQNGSIYWHPAAGAHEVHGEIRAKWAELGWERSFLGYPMSDETVGDDAAGSGRVSRFQHGAIYWYPSIATQGARTAAVAASALASASDPVIGRVIDKRGTPIVPSTAHEVHGAIAAKYRSLGAEASFLGYPTTDERTAPDGVGRYNHFQAGSIYWTPNTGACEVHGLIRDYWAAHGWERNADLGYPISDELIPDRRIGHSRPDPIRKPVAALPIDRTKLPAEAADLGFPRAVVNVPSQPGTILTIDPGAPTSGGARSSAAPQASRNRFSDFENGVVFWRRGDAAAQMLAPWTVTADGADMRLSASEMVDAVQSRIAQAVGNLTDITMNAMSLLGTTGYSFDGVGVHNRRHRLQLTFDAVRQTGWFPQPMHAAFEVQVEVAYEPIERSVSAQIVEWMPLVVPGPLNLLPRVRAALDPMLWSGFKLLQLPDTDAGAPLAVLSVKTMVNGDVNLYIEL